MSEIAYHTGHETSPSEAVSPSASGTLEAFDLDEAIMRLVGPVIDKKGEPVFTEKTAGDMYKSIQYVALRYYRALKGNAKALEEITEEQLDDVKLWLYGVCSLDTVTSKTKYVLQTRLRKSHRS